MANSVQRSSYNYCKGPLDILRLYTARFTRMLLHHCADVRVRVNMNKTKVMISGEHQMVLQKAARWPCGVCNKGVGELVVFICKKIVWLSFFQ